MSSKKARKAGKGADAASADSVTSLGTNELISVTAKRSSSSAKAAAAGPAKPVTLNYKGYHSVGIVIEDSLVVSSSSSSSSAASADGETLRYVYVKRRQDAAAATAAAAAKAAAKEAGGDDEDDDDDDDEDDDARARTVVVAGVPAFFTEADVTQAFETFGEIETVFYHMPSGPAALAGLAGQTAEVVFALPETLDVLFAARNAVARVSSAYLSLSGSGSARGPAPCGLARWETLYLQARPDFGKLQTQVDLFMAAFDKRTADEKRARAKQRLVDDEGFTLVQAPDRSKQKRERASMKSNVREYKRKVAQQAESAMTFYKFQDKERQQAQAQALRRKFDEDKARLARMKGGRNFRPM